MEGDFFNKASKTKAEENTPRDLVEIPDWGMVMGFGYQMLRRSNITLHGESFGRHCLQRLVKFQMESSVHKVRK